METFYGIFLVQSFDFRSVCFLQQAIEIRVYIWLSLSLLLLQ